MRRDQALKILIVVAVALMLLSLFLVSSALAELGVEQDGRGENEDNPAAEVSPNQSSQSLLSPNIPQPPYYPSGTVKDEGANVPDGTVVKATCGGVVYAQTTTVNTLDPVESWYSLTVPADDPDTIETKEGCQPLEEISFLINESAAYQTVPFVPGSGLLELTTDEPAPAIDVEKMTNGEDADNPTGPVLIGGSTVTWTLVINNPGNVSLVLVDIWDDSGTPGDDGDDQMVCDFARLKPNDPQNCVITGTVTSGQFANTGLAAGLFYSEVVSDTDSSHYFGVQPALTLEKLTNGVDADTPPGPGIIVGNPITWTYVVTNDGDVTLETITITDNNGTPGISGDDVDICTIASLTPSSSESCEWTGEIAILGQYGNIGTAGVNFEGSIISATDPSHYLGKAEMQYVFLPMLIR